MTLDARKLKKYLVTIKNNPVTCLWSLIHRLRRFSRIEYHLLSGYSFFPEFLTILITRRCNFRCNRCAAKSPMVGEGGSELSFGEIKRFIDQLSAIKPFIYFSGGEPLLRDDIFEIIKYIKSKSLIVGLASNGSFFDLEKAQRIIASGLDFLSVSIDGPRDYHDKVRGVPGAYEKATAGLRALLRTRKASASQTPHIRIASIIDPETIENSNFVVDLANELGVDELAFGNLMFYTKEVKGQQAQFRESSGLPVCFINGMEIETGRRFSLDADLLASFLKHARSSRVPVVFVPPQTDFMNYYSLKNPSQRSRCLNPWFSATVMPNGDLTPCQGLKIGNIKEAPFLRLWNDKKMIAFRRLRKSSPTPGCFRCGEGQVIRFD